ncbi:hypothetical protein GIB67_004728 [Kingdonia uniflora]|uniref:Uncharacterized protein n=1 Tax=Kingdonia uniflora TaxID=39325 RepID=A0A7J7P5Y0_9MAGN|nr:hypothetical protein GIB67_004728 [Kingdonia uniflora]
MEGLQLKGLKTHDHHILIQHLLPVLLMHAFKKEKPLLMHYDKSPYSLTSFVPRLFSETSLRLWVIV